MYCEFNTTTHAKWILAGEHSVLRGNEAIVFPVKAYDMKLRYQQQDKSLTADFTGTHGADMHILFWSVLEYGLTQINQSINSLQGHFSIENNIPIGAGIGASAAICVAIARWFYWKGWLIQADILTFAQQLEHLFHGNSSGLDIIGANSLQGMIFSHNAAKPLKQTWHPNWYLSFCGQIGITSHCVNKVRQLWQTNQSLAFGIDEQMNEASALAIMALKNQSLTQLSKAVESAHHCFEQWELISDTLASHINRLKSLGAVAAKPTGSGVGGFVLSLWQSPPDKQLPFNLIPV